ncbi:MAG: hypothetical protein ABI983_04565, partial [Acidobacteriota bacterium]
MDYEDKLIGAFSRRSRSLPFDVHDRTDADQQNWQDRDGGLLMSDTHEHESHGRPHTPPKADPYMEFDLPAEIHRLHAETTWSTGHNARTLIKYDDLRVVLTVLQAGKRVPEHKTAGRVSVHVLSGH